LQVVLRLERFEREDAGWAETQALEALVSLVRATPVFAQCRRAYRLGDDTSVRACGWSCTASPTSSPTTTWCSTNGRRSSSSTSSVGATTRPPRPRSWARSRQCPRRARRGPADRRLGGGGGYGAGPCGCDAVP